MDFNHQTATACLPRQAASEPPTADGTVMFTRVYPGHASQCQRVRAVVRAVLLSCPVAEEAALAASELAANACRHSRSSLPGGCFTLTVYDRPGDHVHVAVTDQGSDWDGDFDGATTWPHGLYLLAQLTEARGATGSKGGWTVWAAIAYPAATVPAALA
jgi:hypothetical protein